ncbi:MAG TPA: site-2 protease family protein [Candidatus Acidoferrum sp.]|nr:site-2 protease family protein [Candidatus Acidoferrum sp.]
MPIRTTGFRIAKILGIPIYLDASWLLIFGLITYELAKIVFPGMSLKWTLAQYWSVAFLTSLLFFGSVLLHELAHSVVAMYYKIPVHSITLFIFGGIARIGREPSKPIQELNIAVAGPLASFFLAGVFGAMMLAFPADPKIVVPAKILGSSNFFLAAFNLVPGFPLDGGRIFRAVIWGVTKNLSRATLVAGLSGKVVAYAMMGIGGYVFFKDDRYSGLWLGLIGLYLLNAAQQSITQMTIRDALAGLHASDVMSHEVPTINGNMTLDEYGAEVLRTGRRCHLVLSGDRLMGMMNVHALNAVPRSDWTNNSVQAAMIPRDKIQWTSPDEPLLRLLERLLTADINQMPVVSGAVDEAPQIVGIVTRDSILRVMQTHSELASQFSSK